MNIKRLMEIGSWRGMRHRRNLPVRGQRTHTNGRGLQTMRRCSQLQGQAARQQRGWAAGTDQIEYPREHNGQACSFVICPSEDRVTSPRATLHSVLRQLVWRAVDGLSARGCSSFPALIANPAKRPLGLAIGGGKLLHPARVVITIASKKRLRRTRPNPIGSHWPSSSFSKASSWRLRDNFCCRSRGIHRKNNR